MNKDLNYYIHCFTNLRRDRKNGGAPHKPILLLSLIELFEKGFYQNEYIQILPEFVASFKSNWNKLVKTNHHPIFALPFNYMKSEPFWTLKAKLGYEKVIEMKSSLRSLNNLTATVEYAIIDSNLVTHLIKAEHRDILKVTLLDKYFQDTKRNYSISDPLLFNSDSILHDSSETYKKKIIDLKNKLDENTFQEEVYIRSGIFKREVIKIYNNTCAISGSRIDVTANVSMLDACHIVPFAEAYDDTLTNGIALNPTLHRAFDRGLISISDNYTVLIKNNFVENLESAFNISQFEGLEINKPEKLNYRPSLKNLSHHRKRFGFEG